MQKKILILLFTLVVAFVFCGVASATSTVNKDHINTQEISKVGTVVKKPDLKPTSIKVSTSGQYIIKLSVRNQGTKTSPSFISNLYIDGKLMGQVNYSSATVGKTVQGIIKLNNGLKSGNHQFKNVVDPKNKILESNEKNNIELETEHLAPLIPYLKIVEFVVKPKTAIAERITNSGPPYYFIYKKPVEVSIVIQNISSHNIKKLFIKFIGIKQGFNAFLRPSELSKDYIVNTIKPGEKEVMTLDSSAYLMDFKLGSLDGEALAIGTDSDGTMGMSIGGAAGTIFKNVFTFV